MYKSIIYSLLFLLMPLFTMAQQNDDNAFAGKTAVFIYHGFQPASPAYPDNNGNTGFMLQRREMNTPWVVVGNFHSPQSAGELMDNYQSSLKMFPHLNVRFDAAEAWAKWKKYKSYDSLRTELSFPPGQLAFGILAVDSTVKNGKNYQYRIVKNKQPLPMGNDSASNWVAFPAKLNTPKPKYFKRHTERDAIALQWYIVPGFSTGGFNVYRATINDKQFHQISPNLFTILRNDTLVYSIQDTKVSINEMYRYYITPVNAFGGGGNVVSDTISATCMDPQKLLTPGYIHTAPDVKNRAIALHYRLHDPEYIGSVHIMRSINYDKDYEELAIKGPYDTVYIDHHITPGKKYYYYLLMTDKMGRNSVRSIKTFGLFQDNRNDFPAQFVKAERIKGGVKVSWQNPPDTTVLSGYYVYRRLGSTGKFQRITTLLPKNINSYTDTSKNLRASTSYGYSVVSENLSNVESANSIIAYVATQDVATPRTVITPKNVKAIPENTFVRLLWYDMRLLNADQAYYNIYRKSNRDSTFKKIYNHYPAALTSFVDSATTLGLSYTYSVEGEDGAGHLSGQALTNNVNMSSISVKAPDIVAYSSSQSITLQWQPSIDKRSANYLVYRMVKGGTAESIGRVAADNKHFEDKDVKAGTLYYYYLLPDVGNAPLTVVNSNKVYAMLKDK